MTRPVSPLRDLCGAVALLFFTSLGLGFFLAWCVDRTAAILRALLGIS